MLELLRAINRFFTDIPFLGARRLRELLKRQGSIIRRKRVRRLMKLLGISVISACARALSMSWQSLTGTAGWCCPGACPKRWTLTCVLRHSGMHSVSANRRSPIPTRAVNSPPDFVNCLQDHGVKVSMDGRVRWMDNVMVERLWRSLKYNKGSLAQADSVGIIAPVLIMPLPGILSIHEDVVVAPDMVSVGSNVALTDHA